MTSDTGDPTVVETLLLVDDDTAALQVLSNTLSGRGLRLLVAGSGENALQVVAKERPALVLLDILMPGMDGYEVCRRLMADPDTRGTAVIFLSALDESRDKVKGLALGAVDYITKPFDSGEVLARVETHLTIYRLRRRLAQRNEELESENRYILQSMGEGLYCLDAQGKVTYANPAAARLTGWSVEELAGRSLESLYEQVDDDKDSQCSVLRTLKSGEACQGAEKTFRARGGRTFPVECSCTPLQTGRQNRGAVVVFRDISERKASEAEVKQAVDKVERLRDRLQAEKLYLMDEIRGEQHFGEIVGDSPALREVLAQVARVAQTDTSVLIEGESGTGKESIARAVHDLSPRRQRPLIKVNCAAMSPGLVESELFGHEKGAFTGAHRAHAGHFELADGGSLFLDEFGELPAAVQVKLLRVLQDGEFQRVGAERVQKVDVRIIAASNRDLRSMVDAGEFRLDLYYRLSVFPLRVPPLRERIGDISLLVNAFLKRLEGKLGRRFDGVSERAMARLQLYSWPGNIRELQNVIERAAILSSGPVVDVSDPLLNLYSASSAAEPGRQGADSVQTVEPMAGQSDGQARVVTLAEAERAHILKALRVTKGVVGGRNGAARLLDLPDSTLRSRMKKLGV
jgi:PAS domain S-box-containing protein